MKHLDEVLARITEYLKTEVKTETIIGQQFQLGEFTCVPIMSVGIGFGGGAGSPGSASDSPGGAAAGLGMGPVGFLVTRGDEIRFVPTHTSRGLEAAIERLPDLIEKFFPSEKKES